MEGLCMSKGGAFIDRAQLATIPAPRATATWRPVKHIDVVQAIEERAAKVGWTITKQTFGVSRSLDKMFGVMTITRREYPDYTQMIGFRTSNDKSIALKVAAGASVFVCENMVVRAELCVDRKHTSGLNLGHTVDRAFQRLDFEFDRLEGSISSMKETETTDTDARAYLIDACEAGAIASSDIMPVWNLWKKPPHEEFAPRNQWSLYNSFNQQMKTFGPMRMADGFEKLAGVFGMVAA